jgi:hypothetical protein
MHHVFEPRLRGILEKYFDDERAVIARTVAEGRDE